MAKIIENPNGRRMVRLSADDVLSIVSLYQQQFYDNAPESYLDLKSRLNSNQFYLAEEVS